MRLTAGMRRRINRRSGDHFLCDFIEANAVEHCPAEIGFLTIEVANACSRVHDSFLQVAFDVCALLVGLRETTFGFCRDLAIRKRRRSLVEVLFLIAHTNQYMGMRRAPNKYRAWVI